MKNYVVGFLISTDESPIVTLIKKNRPEWQKGLWNGVGGHIEEGETPYSAMVREFTEETGLLVKDWKNFITITYENCIVWFFVSRDFTDFVLRAKTTTDEEVRFYNINLLPKVIPNLHWLIPLALDQHIKYTQSWQ